MLSSLLLSTLASVAQARNFTFDEKSVALNGSLYQSTFLDGNIYATSSVGRVVNDSYLFKVNADTLELVSTNKLDRDNRTNLVWAVYGIDADPKRKRFWVTNTRVNTVSVYDENLGLVSHLPVNSTNGPRDVIVSQKDQNVYASSGREGSIGIYNADDNSFVKSISLDTPEQKFGSVMELVIDESKQVLYTVGLNSNLAAGIDLNNDNKVTYYHLGNATRASAVAFDNTRGHLFIASQGSDEILVVDPQGDSKPSKRSIQLPSSLAKRAAHDDVSAEINVPSGGLYAAYEPTNDLLYVVNRVEAEVYVIDAGSYEILTTIKTGKFPNHVSYDPSGNIYVTDKDTPSRLHRYSPKAAGNSTGNAGNSTTSGHPAASGSGHPATSGSGHPAASASGKGGSGPAAASGKGGASASGSGGRGAAASGSASSSGKGGKGAPGVSNGVKPVLLGAGVAAIPAIALLI